MRTKCVFWAVALSCLLLLPGLGGADGPEEQTAQTTSRLAVNAGPGTRRYFDELGSYGQAGMSVRVLAKAYDPNNGIWWLKIVIPGSEGRTGWTGLKRFDAASFDLDALPTEVWYAGKGEPYAPEDVRRLPVPEKPRAGSAASITAKTTSRLAINAGPGTRRYFDELGSYGQAGMSVRVLAKAYDPNNGIWWLKVVIPGSEGRTGWTGLKRFDRASFDLDALPTESWYDAKGRPLSP